MHVAEQIAPPTFRLVLFLLSLVHQAISASHLQLLSFILDVVFGFYVIVVLCDLVIILIAQDRLLFDPRLGIDYLSLVAFEAVDAREDKGKVHVVAIIFLVQAAFIVDALRT